MVYLAYVRRRAFNRFQMVDTNLFAYLQFYRFEPNPPTYRPPPLPPPPSSSLYVWHYRNKAHARIKHEMGLLMVMPTTAHSRLTKSACASSDRIVSVALTRKMPAKNRAHHKTTRTLIWHFGEKKSKIITPIRIDSIDGHAMQSDRLVCQSI